MVLRYDLEEGNGLDKTSKNQELQMRLEKKKKKEDAESLLVRYNKMGKGLEIRR